jgi:hypothetical protein
MLLKDAAPALKNKDGPNSSPMSTISNSASGKPARSASRMEARLTLVANPPYTPTSPIDIADLPHAACHVRHAAPATPGITSRVASAVKHFVALGQASQPGWTAPFAERPSP